MGSVLQKLENTMAVPIKFYLHLQQLILMLLIRFLAFNFIRVVELELELILSQMAQKPMLRG